MKRKNLQKKVYSRIAEADTKPLIDNVLIDNIIDIVKEAIPNIKDYTDGTESPMDLIDLDIRKGKHEETLSTEGYDHKYIFSALSIEFELPLYLEIIANSEDILPKTEPLKDLLEEYIQECLYFAAEDIWNKYEDDLTEFTNVDEITYASLIEHGYDKIAKELVDSEDAMLDAQEVSLHFSLKLLDEDNLEEDAQDDYLLKISTYVKNSGNKVMNIFTEGLPFNRKYKNAIKEIESSIIHAISSLC